MSHLFRRAAVAVVFGAAIAAAAMPAGAAPSLQSLKCAISMATDAAYDATTGTTTYTVISGGGSCLGDQRGTRTVNVVGGSGTSVGFGPGSGCPTSTTANFTMTVVVTVTSTATGITNTLTETLSAPGFNDIPGTQPVSVVNNASGNTGPGTYSYKIGHNCATGNGSTEFIGLFPL